MDQKASAKSKRSHSQHGKRNNPTPTAIAQKKKPQQSGDQRSRQSHQPLPSNWDRYEEEDVDEGEGTVSVHMDLMKRAADGGEDVAPKSKGADYSYLIEQARSQPVDRDWQGLTPIGSTSSLDDAIPDFIQGLSPMLSARGKSILSWCGDDNFIVDEEATSSFEVPFLSMDLHALAEELGKLSMSQRLFIEADLLPAELSQDADRQNESNTVESEALETSESNSKQGLVPQAVHECADAKMIGDRKNVSCGSHTVEGHHIMQRAGKEVRSATVCTESTKLSPINDLKSLDRNNVGESQDSVTKFDVHSVPYSKWNKISRFEAVEAEAELDMLLASVSETKPFGSSVIGEALSNGSFPQHGSDNLSFHLGASSSGYGLSSLGHVAELTSLDSTIDDLLAEAKDFESSVMVEGLRNSSASQQQLHNHSSHTSAVSSGDGLSSSGHVATSVSLDDTIDDLLAETRLTISSGMGKDWSNKAATVLNSHDISGHLGAQSLKQDPYFSNHVTSTISLDNTVDDLLAETSSDHKEPKSTVRLRGDITAPSTSLPSASSFGSKAVDDFDTWLDTF